MLARSSSRTLVPSDRAATPWAQPMYAVSHRNAWIRTQAARGLAAADAGGSATAATEFPCTSTPERDAAWDLLRDFTLKEFRRAAQEPYLSSLAKRERLREALKLAFSGPYPPAGWLGPPGDSADSEVLLGVLASDISFAVRAYRDWVEELGLPLVPPSCRVDGVSNAMQLRGGVYLKYNSKTQLCYVSRYDGRDRGVLLQLGQLQLGHFPLGFFDEGMTKPPPNF
ncbi:hypothetical protein VOLCADRAFT_103872 [Volvox carteri f. nagariensis]|uniref:Uncharacterized protein n=1 Tax=Volvox carteri f. nagariensis TaxID=3068 RepID=D8TPS4_VOLCA|nr:uncharacterized protein VOLCADRAFT_103872 [Volvox carteri f. nagariensis]EFJ50407.1 hypothetical protein VOLCADRAFT_103872 [Volvox carteri f. nagariensis]|eukprot:XP_002948532.1 hypothetical protein VOLCADRAFT_103872 [Volvox carteri f. nagariensis]